MTGSDSADDSVDNLKLVHHTYVLTYIVPDYFHFELSSLAWELPILADHKYYCGTAGTPGWLLLPD